ncbi:hypothetical protein S40293_09685 [Stachybotrys chartarum IBT 40293]|nr:hypothetical protein S40293_09685 [Stachybotrys chartarum IBT 40293]
MAHASDKSSIEHTKPPRRKGTSSPRSVLNLTREQLERKRANDRETQRAVRARTKAYIEQLELELQELKDEKCIEGLQFRNKALEEEVRQLQRSQVIIADFPPYHSELIVSNMSLYSHDGNGGMPNPILSHCLWDPGTYAPLPDYDGSSFSQIANNPDLWNSAPTLDASNGLYPDISVSSPSVSVDKYKDSVIPSAMILASSQPQYAHEPRRRSSFGRGIVGRHNRARSVFCYHDKPRPRNDMIA